MQLGLLLAGLVCPFGLVAASTTEAEIESRAISRPQRCAIVGGSSTVNCRSGPGTRYSVVRALSKGNSYNFWCVVSKECVTINGKTNCGWHYLRDLDCFVNGHYTGDNCTLARLGTCDDCDDACAAPPF